MPTCKKCKETITDITMLKDKIKTCKNSGCKCKTHKFQRRCAEAFDCLAEDFVFPTEISLIFHPVKVPPNLYPTQPSKMQELRRHYGRSSWACVHAPFYDCTCNNIPGACSHFFGYDGIG